MMADGKGCKCAAKSAVDCCCTGVDWRSKREVELEAEIIKEKIDHQQTTIDLAKALSEVERLRKAAETACKYFLSGSDMVVPAIDALCDHIGLDHGRDD